MRCLQLIFATLFLSSMSICQGQEPAQSEELGGWQQDPVCQAVFFGVLDGLYRDNLSLKTVDNIIGSHDSKLPLNERMQRSFVLDCPLCEPTFHAFLAYQGHKVQCANLSFGDGNKPIDEQLISKLESDETQTRLEAMAKLIKKWVAKKFESSDLTEIQIADWQKRVGARFDQGRSELMKLIKGQEHYQGWSLYWGCAACNGVREAAPQLNSTELKGDN